MLVLALTCAAQQGAPPSNVPPADAPRLIPRTAEQREQRYSALHRILLNLDVTDVSGKPVTGLKAEDFLVLDNQQVRQIASFRAVDDGAAAKTHVLLVIDTLNISSRRLAYERREIEKFLHLSGQSLRYPTSLLSLANGNAQASKPSRKVDELLRELERLTLNAHPVDCLEDWNNAAMNARNTTRMSADNSIAEHEGELGQRMGDCLNRVYTHSLSVLIKLAHEQVNIPGRSIVIWIGPGWPNLSGPYFEPDTVRLRQNTFDSLVELLTALREAQITLDSVSWPETARDMRLGKVDVARLSKGTATEASASAAILALPVLAYQTGGVIYEHEKGLAGDLARCVADVDSYYAVSIDAASASTTSEFHSVEVKTVAPGFTVRTHTAYYAQP